MFTKQKYMFYKNTRNKVKTYKHIKLMAYGEDKMGAGMGKTKHPINQEMGLLEETIVCCD